MIDEMMAATQMEYRERFRHFLMTRKDEWMFLRITVSLITCIFKAKHTIFVTLLTHSEI